MLSHLSVENIALIDRLDLSLEEGLTILTGETGAGKSIIIDALSMALGARAESNRLSHGAEKGMVVARFQPGDDHPIRQWLQEKELTWMEDGLFFRRILTDKGRSRAFINETPVPLSLLSEAGEFMVEIHGQHDNQSLLHPLTQRTLLDDYAGHGARRAEVARLHGQWRKVYQALSNLCNQEENSEERREYLQFQIGELNELAMDEAEMEGLEQTRTRLAHVTQLAQGVGSAVERLLESPDSAVSLTHGAASELEDLVAMDPELTPLAESLRSLHYELEDLGQRLRHYLDGLETDPAELEALESRLDRVRKLCRKHRVDPGELAALATKFQQELEAMDHSGERKEQLERQLQALTLAYAGESQALSLSRSEAAKRLVLEVEGQLADLHMAKTRFSILLTPVSGDPRAEGMEDIHFHVSTNPGEPPRALKQVASGGELSRIMLAIKAVLADILPANTLIFDEVDVGIGGRVAAGLGEKLAKVAVGRQVLAITHLPQVAAWGQSHLCIEKKVQGEKTRIEITSLKPAQRVEELARMLAGNQITDAAREHAQGLLDAALPKNR